MLCFGCATAQTTSTADDPDLRPRTYRADYDQVFNEAVAVLDGFEWNPISLSREEGLIVYHTSVRLTWAGENATVQLARQNEEQVFVKVASQSVDPEFPDFGRNGENIKQVLRAVNARVGAGE